MPKHVKDLPVRLEVRLPVALRDWLEDKSRREHVTVADVVRRLIWAAKEADEARRAAAREEQG